METLSPVSRRIIGGVSIFTALILLLNLSNREPLSWGVIILFVILCGFLGLIALACFFHGHLGYVCSRLIGASFFLIGVCYLSYALLKNFWWNSSDIGLIISAGAFMCTFGWAGLKYSKGLMDKVFFIGYEITLETDKTEAHIKYFVRAASSKQAEAHAYERLQDSGWLITHCWQPPVLLSYASCRADPAMLAGRRYAFEHGEYYDLDTWEDAEQLSAAADKLFA